MTEGPPKTAPKILEQQLADLRGIQRALAEAREAGDAATAEALMEQHRDAVEPMEAPTVTGESPEGTTLADAERILGKESVLGPKAVERVFGKTERIPPIPFSKEELERAKELGQQLIFYTDTLSSTTLGEKEAPLTGWRLTSKDLIPDSTSKNYVEQTDVLIEHLQKQVFKGVKLPKPYEDAIVEWKRERAKI